MSAPIVSYQSFVTSKLAFSVDGGAWGVAFGPRQDHTSCDTINTGPWCDGGCLSCRIFPPGDEPTYYATYSSNVSVDMSQFGAGNRLNIAWSFWPLYTGTGVPSGTPFAIHSQVGDSSWDDSIPANDFDSFDRDVHNWNPATKISHSVTTSIIRNSGSNTGYIPITISSSIPVTGNSQFSNFFVKQVGLTLSAAPQANVAATLAAAAAASGSASVVALSASNSLSASLSVNSLNSSVSGSETSTPTSTPPTLSGLPPPQWISGSWVIGTDPYPTTSGSSSNPNGPASSQVSTSISSSVVAGVAVAIVFSIFLLLLFAFLLHRRKKRMQEIEKASPTPADLTVGEKQTGFYSRRSSMCSRPGSALSNAAQPPPYELSQPPSASDSIQLAILAGPHWTSPTSPVSPSAYSHRDSLLNLPDLAPEEPSVHPFSSRCSSILTGMAYDSSPLNRPGEVKTPISASGQVGSPVERHYLTTGTSGLNGTGAGYSPNDEPSSGRRVASSRA